jgi:hypothetical protein
MSDFSAQIEDGKRSLNYIPVVISWASMSKLFFVKVALLFPCLHTIGCGRLWFDPTSQSVDAVAGDLSYYQTVKADNPVGYWRLNDTGTIAADEMNQHPGAISGPCVPVARGFLASDADGAMLFDNNCVISLGDNFEFLGRAPYSIEAWFSTTNVSSRTSHIFSREVRASGPDRPIEGYSLVFGNLDLYQERASGDSFVGSSKHATTPKAVVHVIATYDGNFMNMFVDGLPVGIPASATANMHPVAAETLIGCSVLTDLCFIGTIDEVSLYDYALTNAQVASHHAAGIR